MTFSYEIQGDSIEITFSAPTTGWVGVGFNSEDNIVGSDLLLFHVISGKAEYMDMFVKAAGDPREDEKLGGRNNVRLLNAVEDERTEVNFKIPFPGSDKYDFPLEYDKKFWLILAYSTHDEFDHHSRIRKHVPYEFKSDRKDE
jgi:hypothetical protein